MITRSLSTASAVQLQRSFVRLCWAPAAPLCALSRQAGRDFRSGARGPSQLLRLCTCSSSRMEAATPAAASVPPKPREEPEGMEQEAALLDAFAAVPAVSKAWAWAGADPYSVRVTLQLSQRNLPANSQRKYLTSFSLSEALLEQGCELETGLPVELRDVLMVAPSPSGRRTLIVRAGSNDTAAVLEVWDRSRLLKELHVPKALHGSIYNDGWFGSGAAWSPDEARLAYVAEAPLPARTPEWGARLGPDGKKAEGAGPKGWRGVGEWSEDWGELNTGKQPPTLFVLDCKAWEVSAVHGLPEGCSFGQPAWAPDSQALLFVSWPHRSTTFAEMPQRLGIVYCFNRPCSIAAVAWPQEADDAEAAAAVTLTPQLRSAFSPRFSPDGETLVFLSQQAAVASGVHNATSSLHTLEWQHACSALSGGMAPPPRTVVDTVWLPPSAEAFPGLYAIALPEQPFVGSRTLVLNTQWRSQTAVVAVDLQTGQVVRATPANGASWSLLTASNGWLLAAESTPGQPFVLYATHMPAAQREAAAPGSWSWSRLALPDAQPDQWPSAVWEVLPHITSTVLQVEPTTQPSNVPFEAVVLHRRDREGPQPTVVTPHGGPHTAYSAQFFMPLTYLVSLGYNVVLVNYRGSTGFGEASIQSLPGRVGTNDVADCLAALQAAVDAGYADPQRVGVVGGSHGGFLTGHLVGQQPDAFRCAILRNPVCDISVMVSVSDIPDWCFVEAWGTEEGRRRAGAQPTAEDLARFRKVSPASHFHKVKAPLLFMLGAKDRRVPMVDAKQAVAALQAQAQPPQVHTYVFPEDTHALDRPQTEFEQWLRTAWWLKRHM